MGSQRNITLFSGVAIAISMVVGSGLFGLPGLVIQETGPINALAGWLVVILIMPSMIYIFADLGRRFPENGGISLYAAIGIGRWSKGGLLLLTAGTLLIGMPAFFMVGGSYMAALFHLDAHVWASRLAILLAIVTTSVNLVGVRQIGWINSFAVVFILGTIGLVIYHTVPEIPSVNTIEYSKFLQHVSFSNIWLSASIVFWAFQGWENLTFGLGEVSRPEMNVPRIFWVSFFVVAVLYGLFATCVSLSALLGLPVSGLSGLVAFLPNNLIGSLILLVMVAILIANANSWVFGSSRAFLAAAQGGMMPRFLGFETARQIPVASLIFALIAYSLVIVIFSEFKIDPKYAFLITTQGFIILYGGAILGFFRSNKNNKARLIGAIAVIGWLFLVQGFRWLMLYPLGWFLAGICITASRSYYSKLNADQRETATIP